MGSTSSAVHARRVAGRLRERGFVAYFVGGCVRDLILGREPKDYDVATDAEPSQVLELFPDSDRVGAHFGVVLVHEHDEHVEVATFRSDQAYSDGRHPSGVTFERDPSQDALRRDFTINALFMDPETGEIIDYAGGRADLEAGLIRAIGDPRRRFEEDHLRMLRAVRFAARFRFDVDLATFAAMRELAPAIHRIAAERVRDELVRILTEGNARLGFELLDTSGLLHEILPEIEQMHGVQQPAEYHPEGDVWTHTMMMLEGLPAGTDPALALGVLLHDAGKPTTFRVAPDRIRFDGHVEAGVEIAHRILSRLKFPGDIAAQAVALVANHMKFKDVPRMKESTVKRFLRMPAFEQHLELHRLDCLSSHRSLESYEFVRDRLAALPPEVLKPPPLLTGADLIAMGYSPGPIFAEILRAVEDAQLDGVIGNRDAARDWVLSRYRP